MIDKFSGDSVQLASIEAYLTCTHQIPPYLIKNNWNVLFDRKTMRLIGVFDRIGHNILGNTVAHCPDLMIVDRTTNRPRLIIELDGSSHGTKTGRKKTASRNSRYRRARIPYEIINVEKFRKDGTNWFAYIDAI